MTAAVARDVANGPADSLVDTNIALVGHLVRELVGWIPAHVSRDELVSAGMLALVLSSRSFDPDLGVPFGRFAAIRIRGALTDHLRTMDWASRGVRGKARELESVRNTLAARLRRKPHRQEIAEAMGVTVKDLDCVDVDVQRASVLSLQALTPDGGAELLPSTGEGPEGLLLRREQLGYLRDAIAELPDRLRLVVEQYFFAQRKMADIAAELGVTESRVSQLRSEALALLREGMKGQDAGEASSSSPTTARSIARETYCVAVSSRSNLAGRLRSTTLLGETRSEARLLRSARVR